MSNQPPTPGPPTMPADPAAPPQGPVLLAASRENIAVQAEGINLSLTLAPAAAALAEWAGTLPTGGAPGPAFRMHVALEHVRGTNDATVLRVFLRPAEPQAGHEEAETFLASAGLYGLRRTSAPGAGEGLHCQLDVTDHAALLLRAMRSQADRLALAIRPHQPMPDGTGISIGRISLWVEKFG